jgi:hypothetical protein
VVHKFSPESDDVAKAILRLLFFCKSGYLVAMKNQIVLAFILSAMCITNTNGDDRKPPVVRMETMELTATFPGMTMTGQYGDAMTFTETYNRDGSITYRDDSMSDKGHWFVRGKMFCTFYESSSGACFSVRKTGHNCYEYFTEQEEDGTPTIQPGAWNSIGWDKSKPSSCDLDPKTS